MAWIVPVVQLVAGIFKRHKGAIKTAEAARRDLGGVEADLAGAEKENEGLARQLGDLKSQAPRQHIPISTRPGRYSKYLGR